MNKSLSKAELATGAIVGPSRRRLRHPLPWSLAAILLAGLAWYGKYWWEDRRWIESTDDAYVGGNTTALSSQVSGYIADMLVQDNQRVIADQLLIRVDDRLYRAALQRAEANVRHQEATLQNLHARQQLQLLTIQQAEADLAAKTAAATFAGQEMRRYQTLATSSSGSEQNAQKATAGDQQARAAVDGSHAALAAARQQIEVLKTDIGQAEASLASAEADRQTARLNVVYTEIRSPIEGFVGNRMARVGSYVSQNTYLLTIVPAHELWIDANYKEDQLGHMTVGQPASVVADVYPSKILHGRIISLAPATGAVFSVIPPENATGNFTKIVQRVPVRVLLDDESEGAAILRPGLSTTVSVDTRPR
jgi:membrane fusion protein, multidrug efflux system